MIGASLHSFIHPTTPEKNRLSAGDFVSFVSFFLYSNIHHIITPHARSINRLFD